MFAPGTGPFLGALLAFVLAAALVLSLGLVGPFLLFIPFLVGLSAVWVFLAVFFRDPERSPGPGMVSAADGKVRAIDRIGDRTRVSVFMSPANVHVNRFPLEGRVAGIETTGSGFRPAYLPDAENNLRRHYTIETPSGSLEVIQMTGIMARRLVSFVGVGDRRKKGERLGLIAFGSRVDVLFPSDGFQPVVKVGDRVRAGETSIAREVGP